MADEKKDFSPDTPSLAHERQARAARIVRDCFEGPLKIRDRADEYLPKFPREEPTDYDDRLKTSVFYDWFGRTVRGLTGLAFREPPQLAEDMPEALEQLWENIDLMGSHGDVFLQERHLDGEVDGHFVVFVDMSTKGKRPYWIGIQKQDVLDPDVQILNGVPTLVHFRYRTTSTVRRGKYGQETREQIREYNLREDEKGERYVVYVVHTKHKNEKGEENWTASAPETMEIDEIPVVAGYHGTKKGPFETDPPHLALAIENVKHYQLVSDNDNVIHVCSVPQLAVIGGERKAGEGMISPHGAWDLPAGADLKYAEPAGNGLAAAERRIDKSEYRMAVMGLSSLQSERRGDETATSKKINKAEQDSALSLHVRATNDAAEELFRLTAKWMDITLPEREGRWITLSTEFGEVPMDAGMIRAYVEMFKAGFPIMEILERLQAMGAVPKTANLEALELQMLAGRMAEEDEDDLGDDGDMDDAA